MAVHLLKCFAALLSGDHFNYFSLNFISATTFVQCFINSSASWNVKPFVIQLHQDDNGPSYENWLCVCFALNISRLNCKLTISLFSCCDCFQLLSECWERITSWQALRWHNNTRRNALFPSKSSLILSGPFGFFCPDFPFISLSL